MLELGKGRKILLLINNHTLLQYSTEAPRCRDSTSIYITTLLEIDLQYCCCESLEASQLTRTDWKMTDSVNTNQTQTMAMETHEEGENDSHEDFSRRDDQSRYNAIREELRHLSDWHRMRQRAGFEEDENGIVVRKKMGRTRTLKPRHLENFSDDDYCQVFDKGQQHQSNNENISNIAIQKDTDAESFRRFRIFNKFARSVCHTKAIARKEIFEAWAMALYVHETFLSKNAMASRRRNYTPIKRFADLVCSHGLLSWALLLLASSEEEEEGPKLPSCSTQQTQTQTQTEEKRSMTAVCIDIAMPKSSETAAGIFLKEYPQLCNETPKVISSSESSTALEDSISQPTRDPRWDYVEGPVENLVPHKSTLLVGIHACGRLSDTIITQAISANAPLALVPCCHSKKILTPDQQKGFKLFVFAANSNQCVPATTETASHSLLTDRLADFTDSFRKQRLIDAGYDVREVWIPEEFTLKNRVILAIPPPTMATSASGLSTLLDFPKRKNNWGMKYFPIDLEDTPEARAKIRSISGRAPAIERYNEAHPPPALGFSVLLPNENPSESACGEEKHSSDVTTSCRSLTVESLQRVLDQSRSEDFSSDEALDRLVKVEDATRKVYHDLNDGRLRKTFRIHYLDCRNKKARAKELHKTLKEITIPLHFPTVTIC